MDKILLQSTCPKVKVAIYFYSSEETSCFWLLSKLRKVRLLLLVSKAKDRCLDISITFLKVCFLYFASSLNAWTRTLVSLVGLLCFDNEAGDSQVDCDKYSKNYPHSIVLLESISISSKSLTST